MRVKSGWRWESVEVGLVSMAMFLFWMVDMRVRSWSSITSDRLAVKELTMLSMRRSMRIALKGIRMMSYIIIYLIWD